MTFKERIQSVQKRESPHMWPEHTIGDLINAVLSIHDEAEARWFRNGYMDYLEEQPDLNARGATFVADANIGWCFGEGMAESDRAMWRRVGASHPIFSSMRSEPTARKAGINASSRQS